MLLIKSSKHSFEVKQNSNNCIVAISVDEFLYSLLVNHIGIQILISFGSQLDFVPSDLLGSSCWKKSLLM